MHSCHSRHAGDVVSATARAAGRPGRGAGRGAGAARPRVVAVGLPKTTEFGSEQSRAVGTQPVPRERGRADASLASPSRA
ncbi:hypothetical protein NN561_002760 [Cricetulus griseus]